MNDVKAPRNEQSRSPRRSGSSGRPDGSDQLGELEFSDWYETPVFEPDEDELMEEAATGGHGPRRLMARMVLARDARKAHRRPQWDEDPPPPRPRTAPAPAAHGEPAVRPTPTKPAVTKTPAKPAAAPVPTKPAAVKTPTTPAVTKTPAKPAVAPVPAKPAATKTPAKPAVPQDRWSAWATSGPSMDEQTMQHDLDRDSWRRRIDSFLDRWAAAEVAVAARLDRSIERVLSSSEPRSLSSLLPARRHGSD